MTRQEALEVYNAVTFDIESLPEYKNALKALAVSESLSKCEELFGSVLESDSIDDMFAMDEAQTALEADMGKLFDTLKQKLSNAFTAFRNFCRNIIPQIKRVFANQANKHMMKQAEKLGKSENATGSFMLTRNEFILLRGHFDDEKGVAVPPSHEESNPLDLDKHEMTMQRLQSEIKTVSNDATTTDKKLAEALKAGSYGEDGKIDPTKTAAIKNLGKRTDWCIKKMKVMMSIMSRIAKGETQKAAWDETAKDKKAENQRNATAGKLNEKFSK